MIHFVAILLEIWTIGNCYWLLFLGHCFIKKFDILSDDKSICLHNSQIIRTFHNNFTELCPITDHHRIQTLQSIQVVPYKDSQPNFSYHPNTWTPCFGLQYNTLCAKFIKVIIKSLKIAIMYIIKEEEKLLKNIESSTQFSLAHNR